MIGGFGKVVYPGSPGVVASWIQRRWKSRKHIASTNRLVTRPMYGPLDKLVKRVYQKMWVVRVMKHRILSEPKKQYPLSLLPYLEDRRSLQLRIPLLHFLKKYPRVFEVYERKGVCTFTRQAMDLILQENKVIRHNMPSRVHILIKLLMMSLYRRLPIRVLQAVSWHFGFPQDVKKKLILTHPEFFKVIGGGQFVELTSWDPALAVPKIAQWRETERLEKWLHLHDTQHAFKMRFSPRFKMKWDVRKDIQKWQTLRYLGPYDPIPKDCYLDDDPVRRDKRAVGILHEMLSLTVHKMMELDYFFLFTAPFCLQLNMRKMLLEHHGIFHIATCGSRVTVILRDAYYRDQILEPCPIYTARREFMDLVEFGGVPSRPPQYPKSLPEDPFEKYEVYTTDDDEESQGTLSTGRHHAYISH